MVSERRIRSALNKNQWRQSERPARSRSFSSSPSALPDGLPVLTVGDLDQFAAKGGMIGLVMQSNRVRFEVNLQSAERAGLKINSKLLSLAIVVHRG